MHANRALEGLLKARLGLAGGSSLVASVGAAGLACAVGCVGARERKHRATRSQLYVVFTAKPLRAPKALTFQNSRQLYSLTTGTRG